MSHPRKPHINGKLKLYDKTTKLSFTTCYIPAKLFEVETDGDEEQHKQMQFICNNSCGPTKITVTGDGEWRLNLIIYKCIFCACKPCVLFTTPASRRLFGYELPRDSGSDWSVSHARPERPLREPVYCYARLKTTALPPSLDTRHDGHHLNETTLLGRHWRRVDVIGPCLAGLGRTPGRSQLNDLTSG